MLKHQIFPDITSTSQINNITLVRVAVQRLWHLLTAPRDQVQNPVEAKIILSSKRILAVLLQELT